jgi:hypothetical protein
VFSAWTGDCSVGVALAGGEVLLPRVGCDLRGAACRWDSAGCSECSGGPLAFGEAEPVPEEVLRGRPGGSASVALNGGWNVTGGAALARRGARSAGLSGGVGWSGVLNGARGLRERGTSRLASVGGRSSMPWQPSRESPVSLAGDRCGRSICPCRRPCRARRSLALIGLRAAQGYGVGGWQPLCPAPRRSGILDGRWTECRRGDFA